MKKNINSLNSLFIAHRGLHNGFDVIENTIPAFRKALQKNIPIELDVHILKDGNIVVSHDDTLKRLFGIDKKIKEFTYEQLCQYTFPNTNEHIPLFSEVLSLINGKVLLDIELKYDQRIGKLEKKVSKMLDHYKGPFIVKSFHPLSVLWFRIHRNHYQRGQLAEDVRKKRKFGYVLTYMFFHCLTKPDFIAYKKNDAHFKRVQSLRKKVPLLLYTIKSQEEYHQYKNYGDGYICENII